MQLKKLVGAAVYLYALALWLMVHICTSGPRLGSKVHFYTLYQANQKWTTNLHCYLHHHLLYLHVNHDLHHPHHQHLHLQVGAEIRIGSFMDRVQYPIQCLC